jgi:hypothetical protein
MALGWSARRQLLYYTVATVFFLILLVFVQQTFLSVEPTCSDRRQNGNESGIDCGGSCALICRDVARAPGLLWARALPNAPELYTAVAYIQNLNPGAGSKGVSYSFELFDREGLLIAYREGEVDIPPILTVPIIESNINIGARTVGRAVFSFTEEPIWRKVESDTLPLLRVTNHNLYADASRLEATLNNDSLFDATNVTVVAVLFDANGVARAASKSLVPRVARKSSEQVVFTWPNPETGIVRAEVTALPSF